MNNLKKDFPIFKNNPNLVYLDSASTTQKPDVVLEAINAYYLSSNANVHRGMYPLAQKADHLWNDAHEVTAKYINAKEQEVFFVKNATEGINWVAQTLDQQLLKKGDVIVLSDMEHHSNILPWKSIAKRNGYLIEYLKIDKDKKINVNDLEDLYNKYGKRIKVVSLVHMSNVLGSVNDINAITKIAHKYETLVVVDGTQSVAHMKIDVKDLECDFFVFSGHKLYGPTGIGVVYGRKEILDTLEPVWQGGEMVDEVGKDRIIFKELPYKFEAGTPNIEGAVGLTNAIKYLEHYNSFDEVNLSKYLTERMDEIVDLEVVSVKNIPIFSFNIKGVHPHDIAGELGERNICVRAGYHCAQPLHEKLGIKGSVRVSLGIYNTKGDIDILVNNLKEIVKRYKTIKDIPKQNRDE